MIHPSPVRGDGWLSGCSGGWGTVHRGHRALQRGDGSVCAESLHRCAAVPRPLAGEARREAPQPFGLVQRGGRKDCVPPQAGRESAAPLSALLPDCLQALKGKRPFAGLPASTKMERMGEGNRFFLHVQPPMPQGHFPAADAAQAQAAERRGMPARFLRATHTSPQPYAPHTDPSA